MPSGRWRVGASAPTLAAWMFTALFASACGLLLDLDVEQCNVDGDCAARGAPFDGMTCVDRVCRAPQQSSVVDAGGDADADAGRDAAPADPLGCVDSKPSVEPDPGKSVHIELVVVELATGAPLTGATIKLCSRTDVGCTTPRVTNLVPDSMSGVISADVESGFNGYFEATGSSIQSSLYVVNPPTLRDTRLVTWQVISPSSFALLAKIATNNATPIDPELGHAFVGARDCFMEPIAGASFLPDRIDPKGNTKGFYVIDGLPDTSRTSTDNSGAGGFVNLPAGFVLMKSTLESGKTIASANLIIRAGYVTYAVITPGQ